MIKSIIISTFFLITINSFSQIQNIPLIVVEGESVIKVKPDHVVICVKLNKKILLTNNTFEIFRELDTQFKIFGLEDKAITQSIIQVDSSYYVKEIFLTINDINMLDKTLMELYKIGYKQYVYLDYRVQNLISYKNQARKEAIVNARNKAILLATELNQTIGKAHRIEEIGLESYNWYNIHNLKNLEDITFKQSSDFYLIEPGYITITSKVQVSFDLLK